MIKYTEWLNEKLKKEDKKQEDSSEIDNYEPPEYVVQPAKDDKGFFMFKKAFDKMKSKYTVGIKYSFADE